MTINGKRILVPTERGTRPIQADQDDGQQIIISTNGFLPEDLFATEGYAVIWTNLTTVPQRIKFTNSEPRFWSPWIPAGGHWSYKPLHAMSFTYASTTGMKGTFYSAPDTPNVP